MTIGDLIGELAVLLQLDEGHVGWIARKLQDADLMPADDDESLPLHAARLLTAMLAAARPIDAAAAVAAYERASTLRVPVTGPAVATLRCSFVAALARLIEAAASNPAAPLPAQIRARRSIGEPLGLFVDLPGQDQLLTLVYRCRSSSDHTIHGASLEVYGTAPGAVLRGIAAAPPLKGGSTRPRCASSSAWTAGVAA